jgi:hypothetical protein
MAYLNYQHGDDATREQRKQLRLKWFGPSRAEVWKRLSEELGGQYKTRFLNGGRVDIDVDPWQIVLDTVMVDKVVYTRMRAPYVNADGFRFTIFRKHLFSGLSELLGFDDIEVGHPDFDQQFVIRGNNPRKLKQLFANPTIRELIMAQPKVKFEVRDDDGFFIKRFPDGVDQLRFFVPGVIKDIDRLKLLYELFAETLLELCRIGSAYDCEPGVTI